jgi:hypothetical protein
VLAAHLGGFHPRFLLLQDRNDLLFREPLFLMSGLPQGGLYPKLAEFSGLRSSTMRRTSAPPAGVALIPATVILAFIYL